MSGCAHRVERSYSAPPPFQLSRQTYLLLPASEADGPVVRDVGGRVERRLDALGLAKPAEGGRADYLIEVAVSSTSSAVGLATSAATPSDRVVLSRGAKGLPLVGKRHRTRVTLIVSDGATGQPLYRSSSESRRRRTSPAELDQLVDAALAELADGPSAISSAP